MPCCMYLATASQCCRNDCVCAATVPPDLPDPKIGKRVAILPESILRATVLPVLPDPHRGIHHCKGTEEIFAEDPNVVVLSLHRYGR
jgi:hypothetical protein